MRTHRPAAALQPPLPAASGSPTLSPPPAVRQIFREVKFFGDAEISTLKKELEAHKLQLEQLKQASALLSFLAAAVAQLCYLRLHPSVVCFVLINTSECERSHHRNTALHLLLLQELPCCS